MMVQLAPEKKPKKNNKKSKLAIAVAKRCEIPQTLKQNNNNNNNSIPRMKHYLGTDVELINLIIN